VSTPVTRGRACDFGPLRAACEQAASVLAPGNLVVVESTVPPGTTEEVVVPLLEASGLEAGAGFSVAHCPERVLPGRILTEIVENNRIIGGIDGESARRAGRLYETFVEGEIVLTDAKTAEIAKLAENTYRDVNVAFANQLFRICSELGVDVYETVRLANKHPRVNILKPGPGVGGHCLPVDPWFIVQKAPELSSLLREARAVNDMQPAWLAGAVLEALEKKTDPVAAVWGVTYKGNVDDVRNAPVERFRAVLEDEGVEVRLHDPVAGPGRVAGLLSARESAKGADAVVVMAGHDAFKAVDPGEILGIMRTRNVFDFTATLPRKTWESGCTFRDLGDLWKVEKRRGETK
jgi:UDP-N-acetyl-D-mannosaminuronic acid dehydrogenase